MFTPTVRIALVILNLIISVFFYLKGDFMNMCFLLLATGLIIYGHFRYGAVYLAFRQLKKGNIEKAEKLIHTIKNPDILGKGQRSYYYFTHGIIALEKEDWENSHFNLTKALNIGLRTENDQSIVLLNLANVELMRENYNNVSEYIKKIKSLPLKPMIESEVNRIENEVNVAVKDT